MRLSVVGLLALLAGSACNDPMEMSVGGGSGGGGIPHGGGKGGGGGVGGGTSDGGGGAGGGGGSGGGVATDGGRCASTCGTPGCGTCPPFVRIQATGYGIDSAEVTRGDYQTFLAARVLPSLQRASCSWNTDFTPALNWPPDAIDKRLPVTTVDWCDAEAYCVWTGGRLCGGFDGGGAPFLGTTGPGQSEWYDACSANGTRSFPYGNTYDMARCHTLDTSPHSPVEVASFPGCDGGLPGLADMTGNVAEWDNACERELNANDRCNIRGGSYENGQALARCDSNEVSNRNERMSAGVGIRCCRP